MPGREGLSAEEWQARCERCGLHQPYPSPECLKATGRFAHSVPASLQPFSIGAIYVLTTRWPRACNRPDCPDETACRRAGRCKARLHTIVCNVPHDDGGRRCNSLFAVERNGNRNFIMHLKAAHKHTIDAGEQHLANLCAHLAVPPHPLVDEYTFAVGGACTTLFTSIIDDVASSPSPPPPDYHTAESSYHLRRTSIASSVSSLTSFPGSPSFPQAGPGRSPPPALRAPPAPTAAGAFLFGIREQPGGAGLAPALAGGAGAGAGAGAGSLLRKAGAGSPAPSSSSSLCSAASTPRKRRIDEVEADSDPAPAPPAGTTAAGGPTCTPGGADKRSRTTAAGGVAANGEGPNAPGSAAPAQPSQALILKPGAARPASLPAKGAWVPVATISVNDKTYALVNAPTAASTPGQRTEDQLAAQILLGLGLGAGSGGCA